MKPTVRRSHAWAFVLLIGAVFTLFQLQELSPGYGFDAQKYVEHIAYYSEQPTAGAWQANRMHYDQSPVLRYTVYSVIVKILGVDSKTEIFYVSLFITLTMYYIFSPLLIFKIIKIEENISAAIAGVSGFFIYHIVRWPTHSLTAGKWQYSYTLPLVLLAVLLATRTKTGNGAKLPVSTGIVLGVAGLTQFTYTAIGIVAVSIILLRVQKIRALIIVYATGSIFIIYGVMASSPEHITTTLQKITSGSSDGHTIPYLAHLLLIPISDASRIFYSGIIIIGKKALNQYNTMDSLGVSIFLLWIIPLLTGTTDGGIGYANRFIWGVFLFSTLFYLLYNNFSKMLVNRR